MVAVVAVSVAGAVASAPLLSQSKVSSPKGYETRPGNSFLNIAALIAPQQFQQLDNSQLGKARTIKALCFRRSFVAPTNSGAVANRFTVSLRIGHGDYSKLATARNVREVLVGAWTAGATDIQVDTPDLSAKPTSPRVPWSIKVPLTKPFVYDGKSALFYQVLFQKPAKNGFIPVDAVRSAASARSVGAPVEPTKGCKTSGSMSASAGFTVYGDQARKSTLTLSARRVWARQPVLFHIGLRNPNLRVPGLCAPVLSSGEIVVSGGTSATGSLSRVVSVAHDDSFVGLELFVQAWQLDANQPGLPLAGSSGFRTGKYPARPASGDPIAGGTGLSFAGPAWIETVFMRLGTATIFGIE